MQPDSSRDPTALPALTAQYPSNPMPRYPFRPRRAPFKRRPDPNVVVLTAEQAREIMNPDLADLFDRASRIHHRGDTTTDDDQQARQ